VTKTVKKKDNKHISELNNYQRAQSALRAALTGHARSAVGHHAEK